MTDYIGYTNLQTLLRSHFHVCQQAPEVSNLRASWSSVASQSQTTSGPPDKGSNMRKVTSAEMLRTNPSSPTAKPIRQDHQINGGNNLRTSASNQSLSGRSTRLVGKSLCPVLNPNCWSDVSKVSRRVL